MGGRHETGKEEEEEEEEGRGGTDEEKRVKRSVVNGERCRFEDRMS